MATGRLSGVVKQSPILRLACHSIVNWFSIIPVKAFNGPAVVIYKYIYLTRCPGIGSFNFSWQVAKISNNLYNETVLRTGLVFFNYKNLFKLQEKSAFGKHYILWIESSYQILQSLWPIYTNATLVKRLKGETGSFSGNLISSEFLFRVIRHMWLGLSWDPIFRQACTHDVI